VTNFRYVVLTVAGGYLKKTLNQTAI